MTGRADAVCVAPHAPPLQSCHSRLSHHCDPPDAARLRLVVLVAVRVADAKGVGAVYAVPALTVDDDPVAL